METYLDDSVQARGKPLAIHAKKGESIIWNGGVHIERGDQWA